jgi:dipeptidyl aminopeptidase/acylaminoacyl peptidase
VDITRTFIDMRSRRLLGYVRSEGRNEVVVLDPALDAHYQRIRAQFDDDLTVIPGSFHGDRMVFRVFGPHEPGAIYIFEASSGEITHIYSSHPDLRAADLNDVEVIRYMADDGTPLIAYLTVPPQGADRNTPLVVLPHGGPEARDTFGFDMIAQFFAAGGYAVLQPQFRGSAGFGEAFAESGYGQWGGLMQTDIDDAVAHVIETGLADGDRVCIAGFSYGGYAALMGGAQRPDFYDCVFAGAPVTNLVSFVEHWQDTDDAAAEYWERSMGHPRRDRDRMEAASPVNHADLFTMPVLIAHGAQDDVVPFPQSQEMAGELESAGAQVDFAIYDRADHSFSRSADMRSVLRLALQLFDRTIGPDRGQYANVFTGERLEPDDVSANAPK